MKLLYRILFISLPLLTPIAAQAYSFMTDGGVNKTAAGTGHTNIKIFKNASLPVAIGALIQYLLSLVGIIFLILTIYGGFQWMTARGNEGQIDKAKDLIKNSVIGLIIVLLAYGITFIVMVSYFSLENDYIPE